jgi:site-specific DNA-methyltransferase (adenine-specific)
MFSARSWLVCRVLARIIYNSDGKLAGLQAANEKDSDKVKKKSDMNTLYYGDNLEVLRQYIKDETIDLCYIDPPFNSKRNYNQIYNNIGSEDRAQAQAFVDTWTWDSHAEEGFGQILNNEGNRFTPQTIDLIAGLQKVIKKGSLLAYLVSMTLRITEIHRALKPTGSFYLHCDPTASHYLKLVLDSVFVPHGGDFKNEIIWHYKRWPAKSRHFQEMHDVVFFYVKTEGNNTFSVLLQPLTEGTNKRWGGQKSKVEFIEGVRQVTQKTEEKSLGAPMDDVWDIPVINSQAKERLGYPTQKPEALLERIIEASSDEGGTILDAYCGCGTTIAVAQRLKRKWIGMDITYQSIALILRRLEGEAGQGGWPEVKANISLNGIPRDMESADALANKKDDRVRKEFEKWAILTYTNNRAIINDKKGADAGIDGVAYFRTGETTNEKIVFQVKSGGVGRGDIAKLRGDMEREGAALAVFITLQEPTQPMLQEAKATGTYRMEYYPRPIDRIEIVTAQEMIEGDRRLNLPTSLEVLKQAQLKAKGDQLDLLSG